MFPIHWTGPLLPIPILILHLPQCIHSKAQWTAKHVVAHHIDTNITPIDDDTMYPIKRVLPSLERLWLHRFQHIYIWALYAFVFVPWTVSHNIKFFVGLFLNEGKVYEGIVQCRHDTVFEWMESISCIVIQWIIRLLPFFCLPTWWQAIAISLIFELSSSVWFSLQFAVNHETLESVYNGSAGHHNEVFTELNLHRDFGAHQVITRYLFITIFAVNPFAVLFALWSVIITPSGNGQLCTWAVVSTTKLVFNPFIQCSSAVGAQWRCSIPCWHCTEHHLFPSVHNRHYPALSKIVRETAKEFNLPYNASDTFWVGLRKHAKLLYVMGRYDESRDILGHFWTVAIWRVECGVAMFQ